MDKKKEIKSYPCTKCGWAMGEKEGKPICDHCKKDRREPK